MPTGSGVGWGHLSGAVVTPNIPPRGRCCWCCYPHRMDVKTERQKVEVTRPPSPRRKQLSTGVCAGLSVRARQTHPSGPSLSRESWGHGRGASLRAGGKWGRWGRGLRGLEGSVPCQLWGLPRTPQPTWYEASGSQGVSWNRGEVGKDRLLCYKAISLESGVTGGAGLCRKPDWALRSPQIG